MSVALKARDICVAYDGAIALSNAQLELAEGAIVTVVGRNGAGKSSLLNALSGQNRASGSVSLFGEDISRMRCAERVALGLCLVPERRELFGDMSVEDNLLLGSYVRWRRREKDIEDTRKWVLTIFPRLAERITQRASTLSGGERQMLALARALMGKPRVLMLDEPSLGLAPVIVHEMFRVIRELKGRGVSILLVEQNARAALAVADYAYVVEDGAITTHGAAADLRNDPRVLAAYLGQVAREAGAPGAPQWLS